MSRKLTKAQQTERDEALTRLREWIKPGDTVSTIVDHVSASGMRRAIRVVVPYVGTLNQEETDRPLDTDTYASLNRRIDFLHPNHAIGVVLGLKHWTKNGHTQDALIVDGCGMDMGFHLVYELSYALYGRDGYACLGKGSCPSSYHVNHRDRVRCPGVYDATREKGDQYQHCYPLDSVRRMIDIGDGQTIAAGKMYGRESDDSQTGTTTATVCITCQGEGYIPNPDGPERFDLVHTDGYALRQRWL